MERRQEIWFFHLSIWIIEYLESLEHQVQIFVFQVYFEIIPVYRKLQY